MTYLLNEELIRFTMIALVKVTLKELCFWPETAIDVSVFFLCNTQKDLASQP